MPCSAAGIGGKSAAGGRLASAKDVCTGMTQKVESPSPQAAGNTQIHLPRLRVLRRGHGSSSQGNSSLQTPKTPRRRHGRLAAGAAIMYFTSSSRKSYSISRSASTPDLSHTSPVLTRSGGFSKYGARPFATVLDGARQPQSGTSALASAGSEGAGPISSEALAEKSSMVQEEVLLFFYLLDLTTRLQRALNQDAAEVVQTFKLQIGQVENEIKKQLAKRTGKSSEEITDGTVAVISLRADLLRAVEEERFGDAATIRDKLSKLEGDKQARSSQSILPESVEFRFRLGQRIRHKVYGYRGCICGMEPMCLESNEWMEEAKVKELPRGKMQPFYQVLVDTRDKLGYLVAYVAEENLVLPSQPEGSPLEHPYTYMLFYGVDAAGDLIPSKQLREKFNAPRYEVPSSEGDQKD